MVEGNSRAQATSSVKQVNAEPGAVVTRAEKPEAGGMGPRSVLAEPTGLRVMVLRTLYERSGSVSDFDTEAVLLHHHCFQCFLQLKSSQTRMKK